MRAQRLIAFVYYRAGIDVSDALEVLIIQPVNSALDFDQTPLL